MSNDKRTGEKSGSAFLKNNNLILTSVIIFALLLVLIPVILQGCATGSGGNNGVNNDSGLTDTPDTGKIISGTYSLDIANAGSSRYVFDGNKVTNVYNDITVEYTYVIAVENGIQVIKFTATDESGAQKTTTHEFYEGSMGEKKFISINDSYYYLQESAE